MVVTLTKLAQDPKSKEPSMDKATSSDGTPTGERYMHRIARRGSPAAPVRWAAVPLLS
jgi:hypothetical protein